MTMTYLTHLRTLTPRTLVWREDAPDLDPISAEEAAYAAAVVTCPGCGENWHPESSASRSQWDDFHSRCAPAPCDHCGQPTNTPDACFTCYHEPFGIGWQTDNRF